jgi:hypothetical protein
MALEFDGFEAWRSIADNPETFVALRAEASKTARAALTKCLKSKTAGIAELRSIRKAIGKQTFGLLVDGMKDAEVKTLVARLDKHHPQLKAADAAWRRQHILQLVKTDIEPVPKPEKPRKKAKAAGKPKQAEKDGEWFASAGAVRKR